MTIKTDDNELQVGDNFCFGEGEYEDHFEYGHRVVLKAFNIKEQARKYLDCHGTKDSPISKYGFLEWLDEQGFTKAYERKRFYTGSGFYGDADFDWFGNYSEEEVKENMEAFDTFDDDDE